jgi:hypothetical protein
MILAMPPRRSVDLAVPPEQRPVEEPLPANVLDFFAPPRLPFTISPIAVLLGSAGERRRRRSRGTRDEGAGADEARSREHR